VGVLRAEVAVDIPRAEVGVVAIPPVVAEVAGIRVVVVVADIPAEVTTRPQILPASLSEMQF
jgi:hypothetical protein